MDTDTYYRHKLEYNRIYRADRAADTLWHSDDNLGTRPLDKWDNRHLVQVRRDIYKTSWSNCLNNLQDTLDHMDMNLYSEMCFDNRCLLVRLCEIERHWFILRKINTNSWLSSSLTWLNFVRARIELRYNTFLQRKNVEVEMLNLLITVLHN